MPTATALLRRKIVEKNIPVSASFELTYRCNINCSICYQFLPDKNELTTLEVKQILDQLANAGCLYLSFTGGEPLLRKDFWEIAEYAKEKTFALMLQTNGTLIGLPEADRIKKLNFLEVHISILGAEDSTHDRITKTKGSFRKAVTAAELLIEREVAVVFKTTVMKENFTEYEDIWKLAKELGARPYFSPVIHPKTDKDKGPLEHRLSDENLQKLFSFIFKKDRLQPQVYEPMETLVLCNMAKTDCCINPKGEVYPCAAVPIVVGNLRKESFKEIWQSSPALNRMRSISSADLKECAECRLASICMRCPGLSLLEENDLLSVPTECCRITKAVKEVIDNEKAKV